ncbi:hypothetical protein GQ53DRAFT_822236 [Thozetella sp. PMI_491]|nr:hypothetical protein GQ53DRAFT_822236 [Thozetella sp. PMI_491]
MVSYHQLPAGAKDSTTRSMLAPNYSQSATPTGHLDGILSSQDTHPSPDPYAIRGSTDNTSDITSRKEDRRNMRTSDIRVARSTVVGWGFEIASVGCSALSLIALVALLLWENNRSLNSWPFFLPINTVVAILSIVTRSPLAFLIGQCLGQMKWSWFIQKQGSLSGFLAFDDASRGPLGSVGLLSWLKFWHWPSLGAILTVALLAFDPFFQALIVIDGRLTSFPNDGLSTLTRSSRLDDGVASIGAQATTGISLAWVSPDIGFLLTSLSYFFNTSTTKVHATPSPTCRTGNCTWGPYSSLGVCSACSDISQHISKNTTYLGTVYFIPYDRGNAETDRNGGPRGYDSVNISSITIPVPSRSTCQPEKTYSFQNWDTLLASFVFISGGMDWYQQTVPWENATLFGTECALRLCAQVYNASVSNGKFQQETSISDAWRRVPSSYQAFTLEDGSLAAPSLNGTLVEAGASVGSGFNLLDDEIQPNDGAGFGVQYYPRNDLQIELTDAPFGVQTVFNVTQASILSMANFYTQNMTRQAISAALFTSNNFTATFETASKALSIQMRELDGTAVSATTEEWELYVHVRWPFLSFSVIIFLASAIFTAVTLRDSRRLGLRALKTSPLAMLLNSFDYETKEALRADKTLDVNGVIIRAENGNGGLALKRVRSAEYMIK